MFEKFKSLLKSNQPPISPAIEMAGHAPSPLPPLPRLPPDDEPEPSPYDAKVVDTAKDAPSEAVSSLLDIETNGNRSDALALRLSFLRREPVLDRAEQLVGYELALRNRRSLADAKPDPTVMLMNDQMLLKSILDLGVERLLQGKRAFVGITPLMLDHPLLQRLPGHNIVLALQPQDALDEKLAARCRQLKERGFKFALDNPLDQAGLLPWLKIADYVRFNISQINALELGKAVVATLEMAVRPLIALGVDTDDHFEASRKLGFDYFEGYYFARQQAFAPHRLDNHRIKVIELLNLVRSHAEIRELEASVKRDAAITYKILRYINSPASGLRQEIRSIAHALTLLGYDQMYRWLTLLLFSGEKRDGRSQVLLNNALVRARLVELLGQEKISGTDQDGLFLVGILSLLDVLLNVPMATALANFHLPPPVSQALLERQGIYAPYLDLAIACEEFDQAQIGLLASACGLNAAKVNAAHVDALVWAEDVEK